MVFYIYTLPGTSKGINIQNAEVQETLNIDKNKFKFGNLDSCFHFSDEIEISEQRLQSLLVKLRKKYEDLTEMQPHGQKQSLNTIKPSVNEGQRKDIKEYIQSFQWKEQTFPSNKKIDVMVKNMKTQLNRIDLLIRKASNEYNDIVNRKNNIEKKKSGNMMSQDLQHILVESEALEISKNDFIETQNTTHMETLIAYVPKNKENLFKTKYETLADFVVPRSAKKFDKVSAKDGIGLWRVICFKLCRDDFITGAKKEMKQFPISHFYISRIVVKPFHYDAEKSNKLKSEESMLIAKEKEKSQKLMETIDTGFSSLFQTFIHMKVLKLLLNSYIQYGNKQEFTVKLVRPAGTKEQEKACLKGMIKDYCQQQGLDQNLYATKDSNEDGKHYLPFALVEVDIGV